MDIDFRYKRGEEITGPNGNKVKILRRLNSASEEKGEHMYLVKIPGEGIKPLSEEEIDIFVGFLKPYRYGSSVNNYVVYLDTRDYCFDKIQEDLLDIGYEEIGHADADSI